MIPESMSDRMRPETLFFLRDALSGVCVNDDGVPFEVKTYIQLAPRAAATLNNGTV